MFPQLVQLSFQLRLHRSRKCDPCGFWCCPAGCLLATAVLPYHLLAISFWFFFFFFLINYHPLNFISFESLDSFLCCIIFFSKVVFFFSFSFLPLVLKEAMCIYHLLFMYYLFIPGLRMCSQHAYNYSELTFTALWVAIPYHESYMCEIMLLTHSSSSVDIPSLPPESLASLSWSHGASNRNRNEHTHTPRQIHVTLCFPLCVYVVLIHT